MHKLDDKRVIIGPGIITIRRDRSPEGLFATLGLFMALGFVLWSISGLVFGLFFGLISHRRPDVKIHEGSKQILNKVRFGAYSGYDFSQVIEIKKRFTKKGLYYFALMIAVSKWNRSEVALTGPFAPDKPEPAYVAELLRAVDEMVKPGRRLEGLPPEG